MVQKFRGVLRIFVVVTLASAVYAVAFNWFFQSNDLTMGGFTGMAQIIHYLLPVLPIGVLTIVMNIPLFIIGVRCMGLKLLLSSLYAMAVSSVFIDIINSIWTFEAMDPMLACVFGGVLMGASLGMVFQQGATTGGTDLIARLLKLKITWLPMGKLLIATDMVVIVASAIAFGSVYSALYGVVALYIAGIVMDRMLYGLDSAKVAYIISDRFKEIADVLVNDLDRGVTILQGQGGYSGAEKKVLMCAFKQRQIVSIKKMVKELDPSAFIIVCDAHEVLGDGFREYRQNEL